MVASAPPSPVRLTACLCRGCCGRVNRRSVAKLHKLKELRLNDNQLVSLPTDLGHVTSLGFLDMSSNLVTVRLLVYHRACWPLALTPPLRVWRRVAWHQALPDTIGGLVSLTTLKASNNLLEGLPESIGCCTSLVTLDLERNKLWELPTEVLAGMTKLTNLELRHNKLYGHRTDTYNQDVMLLDAGTVDDDAPDAKASFRHAAHTALGQMGSLYVGAHAWLRVAPQRHPVPVADRTCNCGCAVVPQVLRSLTACEGTAAWAAREGAERRRHRRCGGGAGCQPGSDGAGLRRGPANSGGGAGRGGGHCWHGRRHEHRRLPG